LSEVATFGGGCFWCTEAVFSELRGVLKAEPGYAGGTTRNPSYEEVCTDRTGHAEVAQVTFDPGVISYGDLLEVFFSTHDPTSMNRQGADAGTQYRSVIFYSTESQRREATEFMARLEADKAFSRPVVTALEPLQEFYPAEEYHHDYFKKNPSQGYCQAVIAPKLAKFRSHYKEMLVRH
jgi:peptide-methionine (S)-S-oxide reductase